MAKELAANHSFKSMNNTATDDRNADLIPEILNALAHHKEGNTGQRDIQIANIQYKLMERGDDPQQFWADWIECVRISLKK